jgi:hypothetical protein
MSTNCLLIALEGLCNLQAYHKLFLRYNVYFGLFLFRLCLTLSSVLIYGADLGMTRFYTGGRNISCIVHQTMRQFTIKIAFFNPYFTFVQLLVKAKGFLGCKQSCFYMVPL